MQYSVLCMQYVFDVYSLSSSPDGFLYDKEAILENILHQKKESERIFYVMSISLYMYMCKHCIKLRIIIIAPCFTDRC